VLIIRLNDIGQQFAQRELFRSVTFTVRSGEMMALTGPSGSGKSTLLMIASGLALPTTGVVRLEDTVSGSREQMHPSEVAWVPQGNNALGARSVLDNAMLGALARGASRRDAAELAKIALDQMDLSDRCTEPACVLSGGELQRLAIARALCSDRPFLFADEPTGSLDRANSDAVAAALRRAADSGLGVVVATHDQNVAAACDRVLIVDTQICEEP